MVTGSQPQYDQPLYRHKEHLMHVVKGADTEKRFTHTKGSAKVK